MQSSCCLRLQESPYQSRSTLTPLWFEPLILDQSFMTDINGQVPRSATPSSINQAGWLREVVKREASPFLGGFLARLAPKAVAKIPARVPKMPGYMPKMPNMHRPNMHMPKMNMPKMQMPKMPNHLPKFPTKLPTRKKPVQRVNYEPRVGTPMRQGTRTTPEPRKTAAEELRNPFSDIPGRKNPWTR